MAIATSWKFNSPMTVTRTAVITNDNAIVSPARLIPRTALSTTADAAPPTLKALRIQPKIDAFQ